MNKKYFTKSNLPFYALASDYLPKDKEAIVVDIGCGYCQFSNFLRLDKKYKNLYLLDGSKETIKKFKNIIHYIAPNKLFFKENTVSFIHCSHMIEHLCFKDLKKLMIEIDRVLKTDGILMISTPLLHEKFFGEPTHIRPYYPDFFRTYMCNHGGGGKAGTTSEKISSFYKTLKLVYRYGEITQGGFMHVNNFVNFFIILYKKIIRKIGFRYYAVNGYTIILKKL